MRDVEIRYASRLNKVPPTDVVEVVDDSRAK